MAERIDDSVDDFPPDPTATINRVPYSLGLTVKRPTNAKVTDVASAIKPDGPEIKLASQTTFYGTVVELGDVTKVPREYKVLRQDLKLGKAFCFGVEEGYNDFRIGDEVGLNATEIQGIWRIISGPRPKTTPIIQLRVVGLGPTQEALIKYDTTKFQTAFDDTFTLSDGEIIIQCEDEIIVNLDFQAVITLTEAIVRKRMNVVTDIRINGDWLEKEITEIEVSYTGTPTWIQAIQGTQCTSGY